MGLIADIFYTKDILTNAQIPHAKIIGTLSCKQLAGLRDTEFLIDSGATKTTISPFQAVVFLSIDTDHLPTAPNVCSIANGTNIRPKMLQEVELRINKRDGKPNSEWIFVLPYILVMPVHKSKPLVKANSLLGMDVLRNFPYWQWDFANNFLYLNEH